MSVDSAIQAAFLAALNSADGQRALRRALEQARGSSDGNDQAYTVAEVAKLSG